MTTDPDDYSPEKTLITFDSPIPLIRQPISSGTDDPLVLGFKDPRSWASAYTSCESSIIQQCQAGARIGCSISASKKCAPPWWKTLTGGGVSKTDLIEREKCEEREMMNCLEASRLKCLKFAEDKCFPAFKDAKIVVNGGTGDENAKKCVAELIGKVCMGERLLVVWSCIDLKGLGLEFDHGLDFPLLEEVICCRNDFKEKLQRLALMHCKFCFR